MSEESKVDIKVTDKRMFTPDGELREEYRFLEERLERGGAGEEPSPGAGEPGPLPHREPPRPAHPPPAPPPASGGPAPPPGPAGAAGPGPLGERPGGFPERGPGEPAPRFFDLVGMMAEPAAVYLEEGPDQNLQLARLHIDLLALLRDKTRGNLSRQESAFLDDVLYRLQMGYVQARG